MNAHMVINSPVLAAQERAHKERRARIEAKAFRPKDIPQLTFGPDASAHVRLREEYISALNDSRTENARAFDPAWSFVSDTKRIIEVVAKHYGVTVRDILSPRRDKRIIRPRHVAMYLARTLTMRSLPEIGRTFANRDHTTVRSAALGIEAKMKSDDDLRETVETLSRAILEERNANA